jgi:o-succinylbenzoate---CoA ligase
MAVEANWLWRRAERTPDRLALVVEGRRAGYAALLREASSLARRLTGLGIGPGACVALWAENGEAFVLCLAALTLLGATAVPLNTRLADEEAAWQLGDAMPRLLCASPALAERGHALARAMGLEVLALTPEKWREGPGLGDVPPLAPEAAAAVVYTSGTTGRPKGAHITYGNLWHSAVSQAMSLGSGPEDRWLACLPLFHVSGLAMLTRAWLYGQGVVVHERFEAERVSAALDGEGITCVSLVPTALTRLLEVRASRPFPPALRLVLLGGGPASPALLGRSLAAGLPVAVTYGLTETASQAATLPPGELRAHVGSSGKGLFATDLRIVREDGTVAAAGEVGEILVRGPTVTPGYLGRLDATAAALVDGWLHTGDLGHLDADGYLFVADRREDLIVTGGENVYPAEVEAVLGEHPEVAEIAVVGLPDEHWGQVVGAALVPRAGVAAPSLDALRGHCADRLASYKTPRRLRVVDTLPRTASGKLRRGVVRADWLREEADGGANPA